MVLSIARCGNVLTNGVNKVFANRQPWEVSLLTAIFVLTHVWIFNFFNHDEDIYSRTKKEFFRLLKKLPYIQRRIKKELGPTKSNFQTEMIKNFVDTAYISKLPEKGLSADAVLKLTDEYLEKGSIKWRDGYVSGSVYAYDPKLIELVTKVYGKASYTNPLHADVFPGICKMEAEVVRMACTLFNGDSDSCGTMTSGGTESILLACKAYRDYARETKGITKPNMVVPVTAHAAFNKAGQYFGIFVRSVKLNPETMEVDLAAFKRAINSNTIMLMGSAPNFPYGTADDIEAIAKLGLKYNIPVHVDACLGSFAIGFSERIGFSVKPFTFTVKGVTSISVDTHKYGFAPKGSSIILYSNEKYRNHQYTVTTDWPGGIYGSPTINGSRAGGIIAACWATMMCLGENGYIAAIKRILETSRHIEAELRKIDGIFVFGKPATSVIAIGSKVFDIFRLSDALSKLGWSLNALQFPSGLHICVTDMHTKESIAQKFINDVRTCVAELMNDPNKPVQGKMAIYGVAQSIPDRTLIEDVARDFLSSMYYIPSKQEIEELCDIVEL